MTRKIRLRPITTVAVGLTAAFTAVAVVFIFLVGRSVVARLTAAAQVVAAVGVVMSAWAAFAAATSSSQAAREAREALTRLLRPALRIDYPTWVRVMDAGGEPTGQEILTGTVTNIGSEDATAVEIVWHFIDGGRVEDRVDRLTPWTAQATHLSDPRDYDLSDRDLPPGIHVVVRYSDARHLERREMIQRWRNVWTVELPQLGPVVDDHPI